MSEVTHRRGVKRIRPFEVDESPFPTNSALQVERAKALLRGQYGRAEVLRLEMDRRIRRAQRAARDGIEPNQRREGER